MGGDEAGAVALFGPDPEKVERWKQDGRVSKLRSAIEDGGPYAEQAQQALVDIVADPSRLPGVGDASVVEAFSVLLNLDQHAASWALLSYAGISSARADVVQRMIDLLASKGTDAALLAILRLAGSRLSGVGLHAVRALAGMQHPRLNEALRSAFLLADRDALTHLLQLLEERPVPGAAKVLLHRFAKIPADLRKPVARALRRQGLAAARCEDPLLRAYMLVEEERFDEAAASGAVGWQPLAEALGAAPDPGGRTMHVLQALAAVDKGKLLQALRLRLHKPVAEAAERPTKATAEAARVVAAWVLPALVEIYGRQAEVREMALQLKADRFVAVRVILEGM